MKQIYRINGDVLHLFKHGALIPKRSVHAIVHIPQDKEKSIIRFGVQGLAPIDLELPVESIAKILLEMEAWLANTNQPIQKAPEKISLDEFGFPTEPQNQQELELLLQSSKSHEDSLHAFNREQKTNPSQDAPISPFSKNQDSVDNKRVFSPHMFDLSD